MIKAKLNLNIDTIESSIRKYDADNVFYCASYDLIMNKDVWKTFNQNWIEKLTLVYSWMPRIAGKDLKLKIEEGKPLEECIQKICKKEVLNSGFNLNRRDHLIDLVGENRWESLEMVYNFLLKVVGQIGASKILHFSFPHLCLMWDNDQIKWLYGIKYRKATSGVNYVEYHKWAQKMLNKSEDKDKIIQKYRNEFPRILDKCLWDKAKRIN